MAAAWNLKRPELLALRLVSQLLRGRGRARALSLINSELKRVGLCGAGGISIACTSLDDARALKKKLQQLVHIKVDDPD